jgi:Protein of unknown function (DUF2946)
MDDIVKAAMAKWPSVPHCYGWLALDARGDWYMRDDRTQAAGPFPQIKGSRIQHDKLLAFINRNYGSDERGAWYFQNGPQRVYVQLQAAPFTWRVQGQAPWALHSHTGEPAAFKSCWLCEEGRLFIDTDCGYGLVHSMDMALAAQAVEAGLWQPQELPFAQMPARFGYVLRPQTALVG